MKNLNFKNLLTLGLLVSATVFFSCEDKEDKLLAPEAGFTSEIDGKTITLTNTTEGEEVTYSWDFGDGNTSVEVSPSHTYEVNGSYVITLIATNESGTDDTQAAVEIINIKIDGDLSDWDDIPALDFEGDGSFVQVKMENLGNQKLYVYIEGNQDATSFIDFWLDLDHEATALGESDTTGYTNPALYPATNLGLDVLFEGIFGSPSGRELSGMFFGIFYTDDDDDLFTNNTDFSKRIEPGFSNQVIFSDFVKTEGSVAYEFSIDLQAFPEHLIPEQGNKISFFIDEWANSPESTDGWWASFSGHYPGNQGADGAEAATYILK
ncbi:PKD domain-containing protein [Reichenbachiella agarivorans]|uniref:PKD domain-containing protein n=1 Tax=Reichenbachiella agarivorans TaxID=2979464 RepID=A0ABY6CS18_9BACT|nr:PKD domain-containing protein [Reichenbachiella agarivorans]UXP32243.1 PKD domain-containing protein [Reichenbachiella agarivorans]